MFLQETRKKPKSWATWIVENFPSLFDLNQTTSNKINSKFLHKNRANLFWVPTLMIWLRVDKEFRFTVVALSTTPNLFWTILRDSCFHSFANNIKETSSKVDLRINNIKGWFVEQDLLLVTWLYVLSVTNKSCLQDSQTSFVFWQKRARILRVPAQNFFQLDRTPKRTDFSLARVFLFFHRFCETHATLQRGCQGHA